MPVIRDNFQPDRPTLLFSLHPQPTAAILQGTKVLEYRRRFYPQAFQAFVYTTGPTGGILCYVQCAAAIVAAPATLAQLGATVQNDDPTAVLNYFGTRQTGLAIPITARCTLPRLDLDLLRTRFEHFVTPRGYVFLDQPAYRDQLDFLLDQPAGMLTPTDWTANQGSLPKLSD